MQMKKRVVAGLAAGAAGVLAGCVSVLPAADPPVVRYGVEAAPADAFSSASTTVGTVAWSLAIDDMFSTRAIDTAKIALVRDGSQYSYYADGEWADRAPRLLHVALIRSFQNSGRVPAVGGRTTQPAADYALQLDLRSFEAVQAAVQNGSVEAHVAIYARLANSRGEVFGSRLFEARRGIARDEAETVADGLNDAALELLPAIVGWTVEAGDSAAAAKQAKEEARRRDRGA